MLEKEIEKYLKAKVEEKGAWCLKFNPELLAGFPDRIVLFRGQTYFIEVKRPNGKPRKLQKIIMQRLEDSGFYARVISSKKQVEDFVKLLDA